MHALRYPHGPHPQTAQSQLQLAFHSGQSNSLLQTNGSMVCGRKATSAHIQKGLAPNPTTQPKPKQKPQRTPTPTRGNDGAGPSQPVAPVKPKRTPTPSRGNDGAGPSQPVVPTKGKAPAVNTNNAGPSQKEKGKAKAKPEPEILDMMGNEDTVATPNVWPVADAPGRIERTGEKQRTLNLSQFPKARQTVIHNLVMKGDSTGLPHFTGGAGVNGTTWCSADGWGTMQARRSKRL